MPNRIIKESICTSDELAALSPEAEVLFYRLIVKADDFGLFYANPKIINGYCFPLKNYKDAQIQSWLNELVKVQLIIIYTGEDSKKYLKFVSWDKHQTRRADKSKFPQQMKENSTSTHLHADVCNGMQGQADSHVFVFENVNVNDNTSANICANEPQTTTQKKKPDAKHSYAEFVSLTNDEYSSLVTKYGEPGTLRMIEILDNYKGANGKKYKSDYRAIQNWVTSRYETEKAQQNRASPNDKPKKESLVGVKL